MVHCHFLKAQEFFTNTRDAEYYNKSATAFALSSYRCFGEIKLVIKARDHKGINREMACTFTELSDSCTNSGNRDQIEIKLHEIYLNS